VKGIVEAHAGKVWAKSEVGKGSTFFVTLPMNQADNFPPRSLPII
jgi:signal transduction histidine kinase